MKWIKARQLRSWAIQNDKEVGKTMIGLLTGDWHLTDNPMEAYRWQTFDLIADVALVHKVTHIFLLGDIWDRKDRHSKELVNMTIEHLRDLQMETNTSVEITMGNHDKPLNGVPYWSFLNSLLLGVSYVTYPKEVWDGVYLLPFSSNPVEEWSKLPLSKAKVILMHQTVEGAFVDDHRRIESAPHPMPILPRGVPIYSGDVHRPQTVAGVEYIGVPHPVRFNESWSNRVLIINDQDFSKYIEVPLLTTHRSILEINSSTELASIVTKPGDQLRIRYKLTSDKMTQWPAEEELCRKWAVDRQVMLASLEGVFTEDIGINKDKQIAETSGMELMTPDEVLKVFCKEENLDQSLMDMGLELLKEAK